MQVNKKNTEILEKKMFTTTLACCWEGEKQECFAWHSFSKLLGALKDPFVLFAWDLLLSPSLNTLEEDMEESRGRISGCYTLSTAWVCCGLLVGGEDRKNCESENGN